MPEPVQLGMDEAEGGGAGPGETVDASPAQGGVEEEVSERVVAESTVPCEWGITWQYLAGFFDGEGCITLREKSIHWTVAQAHARGLKVLCRIKDFLTSNGIKSSVYEDRRVAPNCHSLYVTERGAVVRLIKHLMPFLIVKKIECQDILRHTTLYPPIHRGGPLLAMRISEGRRAGKPTYGPHNSRTKLNPELAEEIRKCLARGERIYQLATRYKVHFNTIRSVKTGKSWKSA